MDIWIYPVCLNSELQDFVQTGTFQKNWTMFKESQKLHSFVGYWEPTQPECRIFWNFSVQGRTGKALRIFSGLRACWIIVAEDRESDQYETYQLQIETVKMDTENDDRDCTHDYVLLRDGKVTVVFTPHSIWNIWCVFPPAVESTRST